MHRCTGRTAHRGSRGIALLFLDHGTRRGWGVTVTPRPLFTPRKTRYPLYRRLGGPQGRCGQVWKISPPPGFFFIVSSILYKYIHTSLLSGPYICICTLALSYLFVYFSCSYMTVGEGTSVFNVALFGYVCTFSHCCLCSPFVFWCQRLFTHGRFTVACLGPSGSLPLAFSDVNFGSNQRPSDL